MVFLKDKIKDFLKTSFVPANHFISWPPSSNQCIKGSNPLIKGSNNCSYYNISTLKNMATSRDVKNNELRFKD